LGKAARATRRISSDGEVGSSGWSDIDQLTRVTRWILNTAQHAPDRLADAPENDFATSVSFAVIKVVLAIRSGGKNSPGWDDFYIAPQCWHGFRQFRRPFGRLAFRGAHGGWLAHHNGTNQEANHVPHHQR
jgi:hypothetical protein